MTTLSDLASLPTPAVIETLSFETIFSELQTEFQSRYPNYSALLASDPAVKLLEVAAYREVLLRNRINAAAKASLLAFATGSDLDHLAAFYGVERLAAEDDEALRLRTRQRIMALPTPVGQRTTVTGRSLPRPMWPMSKSTARHRGVCASACSPRVKQTPFRMRCSMPFAPWCCATTSGC